MFTIGKNIKVKIFSGMSYGDNYEQLENEVNEWLSNCKDTIFDIKYKHCFSAWSEPEKRSGVGMEREYSVMVIYGKRDVI